MTYIHTILTYCCVHYFQQKRDYLSISKSYIISQLIDINPLNPQKNRKVQYFIFTLYKLLYCYDLHGANQVQH